MEDAEFKQPLNPSPRITTDMCAADIVAECERVGPGSGPINTSVLDEGQPCPMPKRRDQLPKLTPSQLLPPTPCVHVKNKQEAFSPQLLEWCLQRPITVIRGMAQACDLDLSLYTVKSLTEAHPNHPVEIRTQLEQSSDENWDPTLRHQVGN
jgi:histone demethylase